MKFRLSVLITMIVSAQVWLSSCFNSNKAVSAESNVAYDKKGNGTSFYQLSAKSIDGKDTRMSAYKGKTIIVLNTASECGYTPQYEDWQKYFAENKNDVVVLGFPSNQFMGQEPGTDSEIAGFCSLQYGVTFPMFSKIDVKGKNQSPVYQWLSDPEQNGWCDEVPSWNFCKYVISKEGKLTHFFGSKITPESTEFIDAMKKG